MKAQIAMKPQRTRKEMRRPRQRTSVQDLSLIGPAPDLSGSYSSSSFSSALVENLASQIRQNKIKIKKSNKGVDLTCRCLPCDLPSRCLSPPLSHSHSSLGSHWALSVGFSHPEPTSSSLTAILVRHRQEKLIVTITSVTSVHFYSFIIQHQSISLASNTENRKGYSQYIFL